jgi:hypothetical protein
MHRAHRALALISRMFLSVFVVWLFSGSSVADQKPVKESAAPVSGAPVQVQGKTLFVIQEGYFSFTPPDRASAIAARIERLSKESRARIEAVRTYDEETTTAIVAGDVVIMTVTPQDAKAAGKPRQLLAQEYAGKIRDAAESLRQQYGLRTVTIGVFWGVVATSERVIPTRLFEH